VRDSMVMAGCFGFGWLFGVWLFLVGLGWWLGFVGLCVFCVYGVYI
jgi:hypothetical protein